MTIKDIPLLILIFLFFFPNFIYGQRALPRDNLSYPVLVDIPTRLPATGFYVNNNNEIYLVTAKHVLCDPKLTFWDNKATIQSYSKDHSDNTPNIFELDLRALKIKGRIKHHETHDVSIIHIGSVDNKGLRLDKTISIVKASKSGITGANIRETIHYYKDVSIGNEIFVLGYPSALGIDKIPQFDHSKPLLRKGIIAGKYEDLKTIILDCPIYKGNSGSPVIEVTRESLTKFKFNIVGVVSQFVPFDPAWDNKNFKQGSFYDNSGYSIATPIDMVVDLIKELEKSHK